MIHQKVKTEVKGQDRVDHLREIISKHPDAFVSIGFHEDAGRYPGENAPSVVEVALFNEFGTRTAPARAFFGPAIDENDEKISRWREEAIGNIVDKGWSIEQCLEMIGMRIKTLVESKIKSNVPPPNAESTVAQKQSEGLLPQNVHVKGLTANHKLSGKNAATVLRARGKTNTLIDTGLMLRSVTYKIHL